MADYTTATPSEQAVQVKAGPVTLIGDLALPDHAPGVTLFAHGSGSSRYSPRNRFVARRLQEAGLGTLLMDLLTEDEEAIDQYTAHLRFDICLLANRLVAITDWLAKDPRTAEGTIGYFGASTGAGAALIAATQRPASVQAVVSRGGRPDLAGDLLPAVQVPTLLIVGGNDATVLRFNREALAQLGSPLKRLEIVPGATHLFEEPGALEEVARLAVSWLTGYLSRQAEAKSV